MCFLFGVGGFCLLYLSPSPSPWPWYFSQSFFLDKSILSLSPTLCFTQKLLITIIVCVQVNESRGNKDAIFFGKLDNFQNPICLLIFLCLSLIWALKSLQTPLTVCLRLELILCTFNSSEAAAAVWFADFFPLWVLPHWQHYIALLNYFKLSL